VSRDHNVPQAIVIQFKAVGKKGKRKKDQNSSRSGCDDKRAIGVQSKAVK